MGVAPCVSHSPAGQADSRFAEGWRVRLGTEVDLASEASDSRSGPDLQAFVQQRASGSGGGQYSFPGTSIGAASNEHSLRSLLTF